MKKLILGLVACGGLALFAGPASAQPHFHNFDGRQVRFDHPFTVGDGHVHNFANIRGLEGRGIDTFGRGGFGRGFGGGFGGFGGGFARTSRFGFGGFGGGLLQSLLFNRGGFGGGFGFNRGFGGFGGFNRGFGYGGFNQGFGFGGGYGGFNNFAFAPRQRFIPIPVQVPVPIQVPVPVGYGGYGAGFSGYGACASAAFAAPGCGQYSIQGGLPALGGFGSSCGYRY